MGVKAVKGLHLGPPSRECRIMEAALGGDGGAMDHVVDEVFFTGSISEAILRAQGNNLVLAFGMPALEELAAIFTVGRTARQLFLTDGEPNESPLLLRMATDCSEGRFMQASLPNLHCELSIQE